MKFGLNEETIKKINNIFRKFPQVETAVLYGSRAKGNFKNGSDIDLALKGGSELDIRIINMIADQIDDLMLPYKFDLSIYSNISDSNVTDHIKRVGIIFYKKT